MISKSANHKDYNIKFIGIFFMDPKNHFEFLQCIIHDGEKGKIQQLITAIL